MKRLIIILGVVLVLLAVDFYYTDETKREVPNTTMLDGIMYQNEPFSGEDKDFYENKKEGGRVWSWEGAKKYCQKLTLGSFKDWRLPTKKELENISNIELYHSEGTYETFEEWRVIHQAKSQNFYDEFRFSRNNNSRGFFYFVRPEFVENMPPVDGASPYAIFWTLNEQSSFRAWNIDFKYGQDGWDDKLSKSYVMCVRTHKHKEENR